MSDQHGQQIDALLASLRADAQDSHAFLAALAARLDGALPGQVTIERQGGLFAHGKSVKRIELDLDEQRFTIADAGHGRLEARRARVVRGVALKTDELGVDDWLNEIGGTLAGLAERSSRGREALERLLLGN